MPSPNVYSDAEIDALLAAALALPPAAGLRRWTHHYLFGLIAVTGMRLSEAIGLQRDNVDREAGVLTVRLTKLGKSRLVRCIRRPAQRSAATPNHAMRISDPVAAHTSSSRSEAVDCCTSTFTVSSGACPARLV